MLRDGERRVARRILLRRRQHRPLLRIPRHRHPSPRLAAHLDDHLDPVLHHQRFIGFASTQLHIMICGGLYQRNRQLVTARHAGAQQPGYIVEDPAWLLRATQEIRRLSQDTLWLTLKIVTEVA
jgi:hypothetical protein